MSLGEHRLALPAGFELAGKYRFSEVLGSGGFGITYLAEDRVLSRKVAVKELLPNDIATRIDGTTVAAKTKGEEESLAWARERFVNEGRALAACDHPNVVHVYEMIEANGTAYMVTKYEEGRSLERYLKDLGRPPTEDELRGILLPLLSGLDTVHGAGFLHRDIKPDNIYLTTHGRPVLLDFGSARQAVSNRSMAMTSIVTSGYAPFEQYYEDGNQGPWSDIYAMAAVMYRAITGKKPPEATRRLKDDPCEKLASRYFGTYSAEFLKAIDKALSVNESRRPQSVGEWRKMLGDDALEAATMVPRHDRHDQRARQHTFSDRLRATMRVYPWLAPSAGAAVVALGAGIWYFTRPTPAPINNGGGGNGANGKPGIIVSGSTTPKPSATPGLIADVTPTPAPMPTPRFDDVTPTPPPGPGIDTPTPAPAAQIDPQLIGSWQTGTTRTGKVKWEVKPDGTWTSTGVFNDSGTLSMGAAGHIQQYSNASQQTTDVTYTLNEDGVLATQSNLGSAQWHRLSGGGNGGVAASTPKRVNPNPTRRPSGQDVGRQMLNHFMQGHGF